MSGKRISLFSKRPVNSAVDEKSNPYNPPQGSPPGPTQAPIQQTAPSDAPPPQYTAQEATPLNGPTLEEISASFANLTVEDHPKNFPDTNIALAHLKLLEAFFVLKQEIGYTDGAFDLWDSRVPSAPEGKEEDPQAKNTRLEALSKIREKRWALYVARAAHRFETWWTSMLCTYENSQMLRQEDMRTAMFTRWTGEGKVQKWTPAMMPPLGMFLVRDQWTQCLISFCRRAYGMACVHAQSSQLPRRLYSVRPEEPLDDGHAVGHGKQCDRYQLQL
jgi:hypothetical protein